MYLLPYCSNGGCSRGVAHASTDKNPKTSSTQLASYTLKCPSQCPSGQWPWSDFDICGYKWHNMDRLGTSKLWFLTADNQWGDHCGIPYHRLQLSTPKRLEDIHLRTSKPSTAHAPLAGLPGAKRPQNTGSPTKWSYYEAIICRDVGQWHFLVTLNQSQGTPLCQRLLVPGHGNPTRSTRWLTFIVLAPCPVSNWDCHLKQWKEITCLYSTLSM